MDKPPQKTKAEFDKARPALEKRLRDWHEGAFPTTTSPTGVATPSIWSSVPAIDSLSVVEVAIVVEKEFGFPFPLDLIRPGGYENLDDLFADALPKLRENCADAPPAAPTTKRTSKGL